MSKIIIVADLGHFKAYRVTKAPNESARIELLESYDILDTHGKGMDRFTDAEGSFHRGAGKTGTATGSGEPHNIDLEIEKKVIGRISGDIKTLIQKEGCDKWGLAAAESINKRIVEGLDPSVRAGLYKNLNSNLTKTDKSKILGHFEG